MFQKRRGEESVSDHCGNYEAGKLGQPVPGQEVNGDHRVHDAAYPQQKKKVLGALASEADHEKSETEHPGRCERDRKGCPGIDTCPRDGEEISRKEPFGSIESVEEPG